jgi:choline dehydrogenase
MADESFDYIIIGSGSAGGVVAARLSEDPTVSVLLLEAGPEDDDEMIQMPAGFSALFRTKWDWNYQTAEQKQLNSRRATWPRMKALGGCSSMNAMIYIRGNRADYDEWRDAYGAVGWGYDDVLPLFKKAEGNQRLSNEYHGTDGPLHVEDRRYTHELSEAWVESAIASGMKRNDDFNGESQDGAGLYQVTCKKGRRWSVADAYIRPALDRKNLTLRTNAFVTKIELDGTRATGVTYVGSNGQSVTVGANAEIILSGGAINSPQLLMLSGIGPGAHLREHGIDVKVESSGVGQKLQDHPASGFLYYTKDTTDLAEALTLGNVMRWRATKRGPLASNVGESGAFFTSRDDLDVPDLQIHVAPSGFYDNGIHEPVRRAVTVATTLVRVNSTGQIRLRSSDPTWHPDIDPGYFDDSSDLDATIAGYRRVIETFSHRPFSKYLDEPWIPASANPTDDEIVGAIRTLAQTLYHPTSTCAMGTVEGSVVDPELKVNGVEGLRVADASVMPRVPRGNTNAPTIMIGEKCADLIKENR